MASVSGQEFPPQHWGLGTDKAPKMLEDAQAGCVVGEQSHTGLESWFYRFVLELEGKSLRVPDDLPLRISPGVEPRPWSVSVS